MITTFAAGQTEISNRVKQFQTNSAAYHAPEYKEAHARDLIQRQIDATDQQIDALVYQLYGLTDKEIKIVEGQ